MGYSPIIHDVREFKHRKLPSDMLNPKSLYRQFLYIDKTPAYKISCVDYDMLMEKVSDLMCEDTRLNIIIPFSASIIFGDFDKYDNVFIEELIGMSNYRGV